MMELTDIEALLRRAAFSLLLSTRQPVGTDDLAAATGLRRDVVAAVLDRLTSLGWVDRDAAGYLTGSEGLSLTTGPHTLSLAEGEFRTWCAYDALGIAGALGADATVHTACGVCGKRITIRMTGGSASPGEQRLWLADGGDDLRADFCAPTVLLCSSHHAAEWEERNARMGEQPRIG